MSKVRDCLWWVCTAGLLVGAVLLLTVGAERAGGAHHLGGPTLCDANDLLDKSCDFPGACVNACANKCDDWTSCKKCCTAFLRSSAAYKACRDACADVWDPNAAAEP